MFLVADAMALAKLPQKCMLSLVNLSVTDSNLEHPTVCLPSLHGQPVFEFAPEILNFCLCGG